VADGGEQLVKIIVSAAVLSDRKEVYIERIQELSPSSQTELMNVINEVRGPEEFVCGTVRMADAVCIDDSIGPSGGGSWCTRQR